MSRLKEAIAPYNFVSFPKKLVERYTDINQIPQHDRYDLKLNNGYIEYTVQAEKPIMIASSTDKNNKHFFKDPLGRHAIPGSSIRGLIRNNVTILGQGLADPQEYIQDSLFLYRTFADKSKKLRDEYVKRVVLDKDDVVGNVRAGFIYKKGKEDYVIIPAKQIQGKTFYPVRETNLRKIQNNVRGISFMYKSDINSKSKRDYEDVEQWYGYLENKQNGSDFKPYVTEISFNLKVADKGNVHVNKIESKGALSHKGYLMCSGFIQNKLCHYVVNPMDKSMGEIKIDKNDVRAFKNDLVRKKFHKKPYYKLPEKTGVENGKPIFYAHYDDRLYFGFTPYLRIFYDNSILHGLPTSLKNSEGKIDYPKAIFGFAGKEQSFKGRVSFLDALMDGEGKKDKTVSIVLVDPKATSFPSYLKQPEGQNPVKLKSYNDNFELRGIKQYWLKEEIDVCPKNKISINMTPLSAGTKFKGKIYFSNLSDDELGVLLWAIQLDKGCSQNIGLAKPYGYGEITIKDVSVHLEDLRKKYEEFSLDYCNEVDVSQFIVKFKQYIKENHGIDIEKEQNVQELMAIKKNHLPSKEIRNMKLGKRGFQLRLSLPTILKRIENKGSSSFDNSPEGNRNNNRPRGGNSDYNRGHNNNYKNKNNNKGGSNKGRSYSSGPSQGGKTAFEIAFEKQKNKK